MQTETPYFQPMPAPPKPFAVDPAFHDPAFDYPDTVAAWALWVQNSQGILIYGIFFPPVEEKCLYAFGQVPGSTLSSKTMIKRAFPPPLVRTRSSILTVGLTSIFTNYRRSLPLFHSAWNNGRLLILLTIVTGKFQAIILEAEPTKYVRFQSTVTAWYQDSLLH